MIDGEDGEALAWIALATALAACAQRSGGVGSIPSCRWASSVPWIPSRRSC